ncbi:MAG: hypothetical protein K6A67_07780 [Bacteroidales bacterium]|nr:hypothetical protein [Bacteroidales bacterium]
MKGIIITMALLTASILPLMAQYDMEKDKDIIFSLQLNHYTTGWTRMFKSNIMFPVSERWRLGGGTYLGGAQSCIELTREAVPFEKLQARRFDAGLHFSVQYLLGDDNSGRHSLMIQLSGGFSGLDFFAEDERAEHIVSDENSNYTSYSYSIHPINSEYWGPRFQITPQISYTYDWHIFHIELGLGYDLINLVSSDYRNNPTALSSDWDDFSTYYPEMRANPFKEWECGRDLGGMNGFYLSFSFGINLTKIDCKNHPKEMYQVWQSDIFE